MSKLPASHVRRWILEHGLPEDGDLVLCAASGGADSTCLAHVLTRIAPALGFTVHLAHVNHGLRGLESDRDEAFVRALASRLGVPVEVERVEVDQGSGRSPEAAARDARRAALQRIAARTGALRIALGHTREDQAETVLLRAAVGTSTTGLGAMRPVDRSRTWLRPFLGLARTELRAWLEREGLPWVEDGSNRSMRFLRNRIRAEVLPILAARVNPRAVESLVGLAHDAQEVEALLERLTAEALERVAAETADRGEIHLETGRLRTYDPVIRKRVLRAAFGRIGGDLAALSRAHLTALDRLTSSPGTVPLPGAVTAVSSPGNGLLLWRADPESSRCAEDAPPAEVALVPGEVELPWARLRIDVEVRAWRADDRLDVANDRHTVFFDSDRLVDPVRVRNWRAADRFQPFGMSGRQKLSDLFIDRKVPRAHRARVPVVTDGRGILWVVGLRRSGLAPVTRSTRLVLTARAVEL